MPRSASSRAQRAAYARAWRAEHRDYHAAWRRAHRSSENARKARLRAIPGWRAAHEPYRPMPELEPLPALHTGHELFDQARTIVADRDLTTLHDPLPEDLRSEAVLALLEGRDPLEAVRRYRSREISWGRVTAEPIAPW